MKIQISGFSGSGKSTLAKKLGELYNIPVLHIDTIHFNPNWVVRDNALMDQDIEAFLRDNQDWVIDGNYFRHIPRRYDMADKIIILKFNRFVCLNRTLKRANSHTQRTDMAKGCEDKPSLNFSMWVLFGGRRPKYIKKYHLIEKHFKDKVVILRNQKEVDKFVEECKNGISR